MIGVENCHLSFSSTSLGLVGYLTFRSIYLTVMRRKRAHSAPRERDPRPGHMLARHMLYHSASLPRQRAVRVGAPRFAPGGQVFVALSICEQARTRGAPARSKSHFVHSLLEALLVSWASQQNLTIREVMVNPDPRVQTHLSGRQLAIGVACCKGIDEGAAALAVAAEGLVAHVRCQRAVFVCAVHRGSYRRMVQLLVEIAGWLQVPHAIDDHTSRLHVLLIDALISVARSIVEIRWIVRRVKIELLQGSLDCIPGAHPILVERAH